MQPNRIPIVLVLLVASARSRAADWPMFRGPDRNGISPETAAPLHWSPTQHVKWKAPLPAAGNSSPIVFGQRVFATCAEDRSGTKRSLYCLDRTTGKQMWVRTVEWTKPDPTHATNPYCAPSPAADARRVVVWHGSAGVYCYDHDGKPLWSRDLGPFRHIWGYAGSPVIEGDSIILNCGPGARQFVVALDAGTGAVRWQTDEPGGFEDKNPQTKGWVGSWASPVPATLGGQRVVLVAFPRHVNAYDLKSGQIVWTCGGTGDLAYNDPLLGALPDGQPVGVATGGFHGPAIGFKLAGSGDVTATQQLWRVPEKTNPQRIGSGIVRGQHFYLPNESGIACYELATGKELWRHRPEGAGFWASLIAAGDRCYATAQNGTTYVFTLDPAGYNQLAANALEEKTNSTPALSDGQLFIRTAEHLWRIE